MATAMTGLQGRVIPALPLDRVATVVAAYRETEARLLRGLLSRSS